MDALGDRMKRNYEAPARHTLIRRMPVIIRVDGRAFHTYTKAVHARKPFDRTIMDAMLGAAERTAGEMQGFKACYLQSDEASFLLTDYDTLHTEPWFGYVKSKLESITASIFTLAYNDRVLRTGEKWRDAHFDARAFNLPREEVVNYFLWRCRDWERNSISMCAHTFYSTKQMFGKPCSQLHEMLHDKGFNWATQTTARERNGTWLFNDTAGPQAGAIQARATFDDLSSVLDRYIYCDERTEA